MHQASSYCKLQNHTHSQTCKLISIPANKWLSSLFALQLIVMIGLDIVYCVTGGTSMKYVYDVSSPWLFLPNPCSSNFVRMHNGATIQLMPIKVSLKPIMLDVRGMQLHQYDMMKTKHEGYLSGLGQKFRFISYMIIRTLTMFLLLQFNSLFICPFINAITTLLWQCHQLCAEKCTAKQISDKWPQETWKAAIS